MLVVIFALALTVFVLLIVLSLAIPEARKAVLYVSDKSPFQKAEIIKKAKEEPYSITFYNVEIRSFETGETYEGSSPMGYIFSIGEAYQSLSKEEGGQSLRRFGDSVMNFLFSTKDNT